MKILIAEDDEYLCEALRQGLDRIGYSVDCVHTGLEAKGAIADTKYDLLLLDLGLPDIDGTKVLADIRKSGATLPVLIMTARDTIEEKIIGLDYGASDYLTKPVDFRELAARIRAQLRKSVWGNRSQIICGSLKFDTETKEVSLNDTAVHLTRAENDTLEVLLKQHGRMVNKGDLIDVLAKWDTIPSENAIEIIIHRLRRKLGSGDVAIRTIRGFGYVLERRHAPLDS